MKLENSFSVPVPREQAWQVLLDVERIAPCLPGATVTSRDGDSFTGQVKVKLGPINLTYGGTARFVEVDQAAGRAVIDARGKQTRGTGTATATIVCRLVEQGGSTGVRVETDLAITGKPAQFGRGVLADVSAKLVDQFAVCLAEEIQQAGAQAAGPEPAAADRPAEPVGSGRDHPLGGSTVPYGPPPTSGLEIAMSEVADTGDVTDEARLPMAPAASDVMPPSETPLPKVPPAPTLAGAAAAVDAGTPQSPVQPEPTRERPAREQAEALDLLDTAGLPVARRLVPALAAVVLVVVLVRRLRR